MALLAVVMALKNAYLGNFEQDFLNKTDPW